MTPAERPPIETRLASAGLPPLPRLAWLELDLDALSGNLATLRSLAGGGPVHPVVKADAYGHGALPIARSLEVAGADGFCVATMDEALALRAGGIRSPIRVLYPVPSAFAAEAARRRIAIAAGDKAMVEALLARAVADGVGGRGGAGSTSSSRSRPVWAAAGWTRLISWRRPALSRRRPHPG